MKIYISADIEGVCGVTNWDETEKGSAYHGEFCQQMTAEVSAVCEGALRAGASKIVVQDAHDSGRNIIGSKLPRGVELIRGWAGHPYCMAQGLDSSFAAIFFVGYHSSGSSAGNPLAHTLNCSDVREIKLNGKRFSEYHCNALIAASEGVPVALLSGDAEICREAETVQPGLVTVATKSGCGASTHSSHPLDVCERLCEQSYHALLSRGSLLELPRDFMVQIDYMTAKSAYRNGFYPGATQESATSISFSSKNYFDVLRFFHFVL